MTAAPVPPPGPPLAPPPVPGSVAGEEDPESALDVTGVPAPPAPAPAPGARGKAPQVRLGRALVAGAAGFIGSHLCERLLADGWHVIGLDDLSTGSEENLGPLLEEPRFRFVRHDVTEALAPEMLGAGRLDWVFNLACPASPAWYQRYPVRTLLASTQGTWRLLELAAQHRARLLQASTSEVYGNPEVHPQPESYRGHVNTFGPRACYDEGKRCAEALCYAYLHERGSDLRIARLFNCYGPRLRPGDGRVVSNFVVQALSGRPLTVYGHGTQTRSFCYVDDTVAGLLALMDSTLREPVNLGNPNELTVMQLAGEVLRLTCSRSPVVQEDLPVDDPERRMPDISRARRELGWTPRVELTDGLLRTIAYFRARARQPEAR